MKGRAEGAVERLVAFGLSAASVGFWAMAFFYGREISALPPDRFQGGEGFALNAPLMMYGAAGIPFCLLGALFLLGSIWGKWREVRRFPNPITLLFLLPGLLVSTRVVQVLVTG